MCINSVFAQDNGQIKEFTVDKTEINLGESVFLNWDVVGAKKIILISPYKMPDIDFDLKASFEIWPEETTIFTLLAYDNNNQIIDQKNLTVKVKKTAVNPIEQKPNILAFTAFRNDFVSDYEFTLNWSLEFAKSAEILDSNGKTIPIANELLSNGSLTVKPSKSTTYSLVMKGNNDVEYVKSIHLDIPSQEPRIEQFRYINLDENNPGQDIDLFFNVKNAKEAKIIDSNGKVIDILEKFPNGQGKLNISLDKTTTFQLIMIGTNGIEYKDNLTVDVPVKMPIIKSLTASNNTIRRGKTVKLSWSVENATTLYLKINNDFFSQYLSKYANKSDILFQGSLTPYLAVNLERSEINSISSIPNINNMNLFFEREKIEETDTSMPTINTSKVKDSKFKGKGVKIGILEYSSGDHSNLVTDIVTKMAPEADIKLNFSHVVQVIQLLT